VTDDVYRLDAVSFRYGSQPALQDVSLGVCCGDIVGVVGPNGAGKTTLVKLLGGLLRGWQGEIRFEGAPLERWKRRDVARRVAYVPQQTHLAFPYTVRDVVLMGRLPHQNGRFFESARDLEEVERALSLTDCRHLAGRSFNSLSGGERQLVILASALAQEPQVLLLDEPTVFLDLKHQLAIARILSDLHRDRRLTLVLVTHDLSLAQVLSTRLLAIKAGRLVAAVTRGAGERALALCPELVEQVFDVRAERGFLGDERRIVVAWGR